MINAPFLYPIPPGLVREVSLRRLSFWFHSFPQNDVFASYSVIS